MEPTPADPATQRMGPSRRLILSGVLLGLVPATAVSINRALFLARSTLPGPEEAIIGSTIFCLIYISPYLIALYAYRLSHADKRAPLLLAAALLSLAASFAIVSWIGLTLVPATIVLSITAAMALRASGGGIARRAAVSLGALAATVLIVTSFLVLFSHADPRCWQHTIYRDSRIIHGDILWINHFRLEGAKDAPGPDWGCIGNMITTVEALAGLGLLSVGLLVLAGASRYSRRTVQKDIA